MVSAKSKSEFTILKMSPGTLKIKTTPTKKTSYYTFLSYLGKDLGFQIHMISKF